MTVAGCRLGEHSVPHTASALFCQLQACMPLQWLTSQCIPSDAQHAAMLQRDGGGAAPPAAQPTASGTPAANALLALAASNASPSHRAEAEPSDANGANDAAAASSGVLCITPALWPAVFPAWHREITAQAEQSAQHVEPSARNHAQVTSQMPPARRLSSWMVSCSSCAGSGSRPPATHPAQVRIPGRAACQCYK